MWWRSILIASLIVLSAAAVVYVREPREDRATIAAQASRMDLVTMTALYAGGPPDIRDPGNTRQEANGFDVNEGKRLYHWMNCNGCHANGGGDVGPALMDDKWIYGSEPRNVFATIVQGRPNGMPSYRGKIPDAQVWQIVAYVRSMSGLVPIQAAPGRNDDLQGTAPETMAPRTEPQPGGLTPRDERTNVR